MGGVDGYVRPGLSEKLKIPLLFNLSARAVVKRIFAVLDCAYASQALYFSPFYAAVRDCSV